MDPIVALHGTERILVSWNMLMVWVRVLLPLSKTSANFAMLIHTFLGMCRKLFEFIIFFFVFIVAFASAEYIAFGGVNESARSFFHAFVNTFYKSMGDVDPGEEEYQNAYSDPFDYPTFMLILFLLIIVLLLQNFLIAFMGDAYEDTKDKAKAMWCYEQFKMIEEKRKQRQLRQQRERAEGGAVGGFAGLLSCKWFRASA